VALLLGREVKAEVLGRVFVARGRPLEASTVIELNVVVRTVVVPLVEEVDARPSSLGVVVVPLGIGVV
jgi:hypothetical protein